METSEYISTVESLHTEARRRGLFFQTCEDEALAGRWVTLGGRRVVSFSSCSYLGLERHPRLVAAVHDAVDRYGTQFSSSRGYLSAPPYAALEERLSRLFGGHALVTSSTTIGHQVALGVLCTEKDAIVLDHQVHHSVHMAATLARSGGTLVELVKHGEIERAEARVRELSKQRRTVWFACDGVFSMYGDLVRVDLLQRILAVAPNVRLYVDDAHGMSWAGEHGRGSFLSRVPLSERMVVATSLNKAFSAAGGCLVFSSLGERERVRTVGGPMVFSGPLQPPMLGAAIASADVHLSPEIVTLQDTLRARVRLANTRIREAGLPLLVENDSPIIFLRLGLPRVAFRVAEQVLADGCYVNVSTYPAVPMKRAGIRLTLTAAHSPEDVEQVVARLAAHVPAALAEEGVTPEQLEELFARALPPAAATPEEAGSARPAPGPRPRILPAAEVAPALAPVFGSAPSTKPPPSRIQRRAGALLTLAVERTIHAVDRALWDRTLGSVAAVSWDAMAAAESVFSRDQARPEHRWEFLYLVVKDAAGAPVAVTLFTTALCKDDMLMRDEVSRAVEARRARDPYFLTSRVLSMGSLLSEGNHLYLDRTGPWEEALRLVLGAATAEYERTQAAAMILRDLPASDPEMDAFFLDAGLVKVPMLDTHHLRVAWKDQAGYLASLNYGKRRILGPVAALSPAYTSSVVGPDAPPEELDHLHRLYRAVAERKLRLNVFALPDALIAELARCPSWEVVALRLDPARGGPADGRPVAWYAAHKHGGHYAPFFCGLDYRFVESHSAYRQMLLQIVARATALGMETIHLGMDADTEKHRLGSTAVQSCIYVEARDHYAGALLREIVAEVGVGQRPDQRLAS